MDLLQRKFTAQSVALATGTTSKQISDWTNQGLIIGQRGSLGRGHRREFNWYNVIEVALANALMEIGVRSPSDAFRAAQEFAHLGHTEVTWEGEEPTGLSQHRLPGLPFHFVVGDTFLCVAGAASVVALDDGENLSVASLGRQLGKAGGFIAINVTRVFFEVARRMALDGREVLDSIYEESAS